jgi:quercetin dioxygenase-like cupin family protein
MTEAEIRLPTKDLVKDLAFFTKTLGFRLEQIFPADNPAIVVLSGHGTRFRLETDAVEAPGTLRILSSEPDGLAGGEQLLISPGGTRVEIENLNPALVIPPTEHSFIVRKFRDGEPWGIGRAGMNYRDLIPGRLGGSIIASHIRIPGGGPVPDMVHYHTIGFQLIFCYKGWVDLVYEDQGPEFRLSAGDCVIQPPEIRHRVLFASESEDLEVIEIGVPAEHITTIDHNMDLPNGPKNPDRLFQGQKFVHHKQSEATWTPWRVPGFIHRDTGINAATQGVANVQVAKFDASEGSAVSHNADILFNFVMAGSMVIEGGNQEPAALSAGDAFVLPPDMRTRYSECTSDLELLEVSLPGIFETTVE